MDFVVLSLSSQQLSAWNCFKTVLTVAKAVKSRARCTTLEAARASETKFTLYFFTFLREFFTTFLFKLSYVQL